MIENKGLSSNKLLSIERYKLLYNENELASMFNNYFIDIILSILSINHQLRRLAEI